MKNEQMISFNDFLLLYPEVELPITLTSEDSVDFSRHNSPIPLPMVDEFLAAANDDELTEYVACFKVPETNSFHALVTWKAGLMEYEYQVTTYDLVGNLIDKRTISGTKSNGESIIRSVATIESDWLINVVEGSEVFKGNQSTFNASASRVSNFEITANGEVIIAE
ncbi:MAG: hypothetical protein ACPG19_06260 [Saprospiraceae bacterium]